MQSVAIGNYVITLDGQLHFVSEAALWAWSVCHARGQTCQLWSIFTHFNSQIVTTITTELFSCFWESKRWWKTKLLVQHGLKGRIRWLLPKSRIFHRTIAMRDKMQERQHIITSHQVHYVLNSLFSADLGDKRLPNGLPQRGVGVPLKQACKQRLKGHSAGCLSKGFLLAWEAGLDST